MKTSPIVPGDSSEKVCAWLKSIGLKSEYIDTFQEEGIDGTELLYDIDMRLLLVDFKFPQLRAKRLLQNIEKLRRNLPESQRVIGLTCDHCGLSTHGVPHECLNDSKKSICWDCFLYESSYGTLPTEETWKKWRSPPEKAEPEVAPSQTSKEDRRRKLQDSFSLFTPLDLFDLDIKTNHNVTALKRIPGVGRGNSQTMLDEIRGGKFTLLDVARILNETTDGIICWENWKKKHFFIKYQGKYLGHDQQISEEKPPERAMINAWDLDLREETPPLVTKSKPRKKAKKKAKPSGSNSGQGKRKKPKAKSKAKPKSKPIAKARSNTSRKGKPNNFVALSQKYKCVYVDPSGKYGTLMTAFGVKFSVGEYETELEAAQMVNQKCKDLGMRMKNPSAGLPPERPKPVVQVKDEPTENTEPESVEDTEKEEESLMESNDVEIGVEEAKKSEPEKSIEESTAAPNVQ